MDNTEENSEAGSGPEMLRWVTREEIKTERQESRFCPDYCCTYTDLFEQTLPAKCWMMTRAKHLYIVTLSSMVSCIIIAVFVILDSANVVEQAFRYDDIGNCQVLRNGSLPSFLKICSFQIEINQDMPAPVYFYYAYKNFNQNHRRYIKSFSMKQLMGTDVTDLVDCEPLETRMYNGKKMYPCGLHAYTYPPDRFNVEISGELLCPVCNITTDAINRSSVWETTGTWVKDNIAWNTDVSIKFSYRKNPELVRSGPIWNDSYDLKLPRVDDQDFIVWMRPALMHDFRKLYRVIETRSISQGEIMTVTISNFWDNQKYDSEKWLVLNTFGMLGGDNSYFVGICAFTVMISLASLVLLVVLRSMDRATVIV